MTEQEAAAAPEPDAEQGPSILEMVGEYWSMAQGPIVYAGETVLNLVFDYAIYAVVAYILYKAGIAIYKYVMTLFVSAESNEWLVISRNGQIVNAGIGLACMVSPFDSIAKFPSTLVKVEVETLQVTKEYQGVKVCSMLEWSIDREGQGPLRALHNLNLLNGFGTANDVLRALAGAVVRNRISNSSIESILKDRDGLREVIMTEIAEKAKGWGVHIGTVEVTDMRIMSASLFSDMQTQFREENIKKARLEKLVVSNQIWTEQQKDYVVSKKRDLDADLIETRASQQQQLKNSKQNLEDFKKELATLATTNARKHQQNWAIHVRNQERNEADTRRSLEAKKVQILNSIETERADAAVNAQYDTEMMASLVATQDSYNTEAANERLLKKEGFDLEKKLLSDPVNQKLRMMKLVEHMYTNSYCSSLNVNAMTGEDPYMLILKNYLSCITAATSSTAVVAKK